MLRKPKDTIPPWKQGATKGFKLAVIIGAGVLLWLLAGKFSLLGQNLFDVTLLLMSVLLFILGLPSSLIIRLDLLGVTPEEINPGTLIVFSFIVVGINFVVLGAILGFLKKK